MELTTRQADEQFAAIRSMPVTIPPAERFKKTIKDVKDGGFIRFDGKTYRVEETSRYEEGKGKNKWTWYELKLFCLETGEIAYLEWELDDEIEIYLTTAQVKFSDLTGADGSEIDEDVVEAMSDKERGTIVCRGTSYKYDDDFAATFFRNATSKGESGYFYDFEAPNGDCLSVEEWGSEADGYEYLLYLSREINPKSVEVLAIGAN